jgi:hypothetical protein
MIYIHVLYLHGRKNIHNNILLISNSNTVISKSTSTSTSTSTTDNTNTNPTATSGGNNNNNNSKDDTTSLVADIGFVVLPVMDDMTTNLNKNNNNLYYLIFNLVIYVRHDIYINIPTICTNIIFNITPSNNNNIRYY